MQRSLSSVVFSHALSLSVSLSAGALLVTNLAACNQTPTSDGKTDAKPDAKADTKTAGAAADAQKKDANVANPNTIPAPADVAAAPADAEKTASGLASKVLTPGKPDGEQPTADDSVEVHYTGWTTDGKMFDSSVVRGRTAKFPLKGVIKGWTEGVPLMKVGEKRRFWIPGNLAYGDTPTRPGAPAGTLVFDVELINVIKAPKPIPAPEDVAAAPASATKTKSGLSYKVLKAGDGKAHPKATSSVTVHYTGWTTDGKMFDSSVMRGEPATFPLNGVIPGWTEGVQLMTVGEKTRFWIPGSLAYGDKPMRPGAPAGTLVFDVELLSIKE